MEISGKFNGIAQNDSGYWYVKEEECITTDTLLVFNTDLQFLIIILQ